MNNAPHGRQKSVDVHQFAMVPRADIPRSSFRREFAHKTTFDAGYLIPVYHDEILPGDTFRVRAAMFARMSTPLYPLMDNLHMDVFFFFIPNRLVWSNWKKFMGEQATPASSISYTIPQSVSKASGYDINSLHDYFGLPTAGQVTAAQTVSHNNLPLRGYNLVWNEWFRDENLQDSVTVDVGDGPDTYSNYVLLRRGKRFDYFTSALPNPQKGSTAVSIPIGTSAPVKTSSTAQVSGSQQAIQVKSTSGGGAVAAGTVAIDAASKVTSIAGGGASVDDFYLSNLYADLSSATAATINQLRQAFQVQKVLERDARGGTRYTEILQSHFGVKSPDARLQRPEYLGGGSFNVSISPITQNTQSGLTGGTTPLGSLGGVAAAVGQCGFSQSFTEHGYVLGLVAVRADLNYQQGLERHWRRSTRYDYYLPAFAMLGEQAIYNYEIYCKGDATAADAQVFGYQERWGELRYKPSMITGQFRSTYSSTLDAWHLAQKFTSLPTLNSTFIQDTPPMDRVLATASQTGRQFIYDSVFSIKAARPLPMYSVPGMIDRF